MRSGEVGILLPAEGEEQTFKDQHWPGAAKDGEGLASHQAEGSSSHCRAQEAFQHPLEANNGPCQHRYPSSLGASSAHP